jgi:hypothetical protein
MEACGQTSVRVTRDSGVDGLARITEALRDLDDLPAVLHDHRHRFVPLFHDR